MAGSRAVAVCSRRPAAVLPPPRRARRGQLPRAPACPGCTRTDAASDPHRAFLENGKNTEENIQFKKLSVPRYYKPFTDVVTNPSMTRKS